MDPTTIVLIGTHVLAFAVGGGFFRWLTLRTIRVRTVDGHLAVELRHCADDD